MFSVFKSMLEVASSKSSILLRFKNALAMQTNCFSPELRFSPLSIIWVSNPCLA